MTTQNHATPIDPALCGSDNLVGEAGRVVATSLRAGKQAGRGWQWPLLVVALLAIPVAAHAFLIAKALRDPGLAVERDYYKRAVAWDAEMAQQRDNGTLAWQVSVEPGPLQPTGTTATVRALDSRGQPLPNATVRVRARHNARPAETAEATALTDIQGRATVALVGLQSTGLHAFGVEVAAGPVRFTATRRRDIAR